MILTRTNLVLAIDSTRVVHGQRGSYVEIDPKRIMPGSIFVPKDCEWRFDSEWRDRVFYREYRTRDSTQVKVYLQVEVVSYADYLRGHYYVAREDVKYG